MQTSLSTQTIIVALNRATTENDVMSKLELLMIAVVSPDFQGDIERFLGQDAWESLLNYQNQVVAHGKSWEYPPADVMLILQSLGDYINLKADSWESI